MDVQPVRGESGELTNFIAIQSDITERKRTDRRLRESEERQRRILDTTLEAVITIDAAGTITQWNDAAVTTFGWTRDEAIDRRLADTIIPERFREAHQRGLAHYLKTGEGPALNQRLELSALRQSGEEFPCELTISPLQYGEEIAFSAFLRDITERKQHEDALKRSNAIFQAQHKAAIDGILVVDENRKILHYNERFLALWGIDSASAEQADDQQLLAWCSRNWWSPQRFKGHSMISTTIRSKPVATRFCCTTVGFLIIIRGQ